MERMEDSRSRPHRLGRAQGGRIVPVEGGGHIVRSTDRKDRHSKVSTAKGLRDRRVRLAAHTAIQFYDVQDRLGYDRPSKAVDWLIHHAKPAIDELALLPPWNPTADADQPPVDESLEKPALAADFGNTNFLPPEPFLPSCHQDLRLSLQSLQDPIFTHPDAPIPTSHQTLFDIPWNSPDPAAATGAGAGYVFYSPAGESQQLLFTQRGPLQSSNSPSVRAWMDMTGGHQLYPAPFYPPPQAVPAIGFSSDGGGFSGFHLPARIQGEEEEHGNAASSASHHHHYPHH